MLVFAADTATEYCNLSLFEDNTRLANLSFKNRGTHSKNIIENIDYCYKLAGKDIKETDLFAAGTGPGNFTGVRIGVSTLKGISYSMKKPLVGISSLDSIAYSLRFSDKKILSVVDARRGEVYYSFYDFKDGKLINKTEESVDKPENISFKDCDKGYIVTGNASKLYKDVFDLLLKNVYYPPAWMTEISSDLMCEIAIDKYEESGLDETFGIVPNYIRKSNAEENMEKNRI
jgi:tRNA threonylcarbamoyl adenosine modification protein YeaZ